MESPPKLSGETLIVHHIPLVHCQVSGPRRGGCAGSLKRSNPFSPPENLGLSRTTSLPERDVLQREALLYSSLIQTSSGAWVSHGEAAKRSGGSTASDDSSFTSSNSEEQLAVAAAAGVGVGVGAAHTLPRAKAGRSRNPLRHNPFLLHTEDDEDEEEEEEEEEQGEDGGSLSGYMEDSSFHLHGDERVEPYLLHNMGEPFLLHGSEGGSSRESLRDAAADLDQLLLLGRDGQRRLGSSGSNMSVDCVEQDWPDEDEDGDHLMRGRKAGSCSSGSSAPFPPHRLFPEPGYASDSSCNSSDGVLVSFSAIYNKMSNGGPESEPPPGPDRHNFNDSPLSDPPGMTGEAFYLDLHTSPTEPQKQLCYLSHDPVPPLLLCEPHRSTSCSAQHQDAFGLDDNCNSFLPTCPGGSCSPSSLSPCPAPACLQSQARLVVATQNYYKLVTCDVSSQSSPSPAGSSVHSCSDEHGKGSPPSPTQPDHYFLFKQRDEGAGGPEGDRQGGDTSQPHDENEAEKRSSPPAGGAAGASAAGSLIEGRVYVNVSPSVSTRSLNGNPPTPLGHLSSSSSGRPRSRSYDRTLDRSPTAQLGSLERMMSCPVRLSEQAACEIPPANTAAPPRVTSFAEIARSKRRCGVGGSPPQRAPADALSSSYSAHSHSSGDFSPIPEHGAEARATAGPSDSNTSPSPPAFSRCFSQGSVERLLEGAGEEDGRPLGSVVRYSKEQRPTTLPIQPFTFHHQFPSKPPQPKPLLPLLTGYVSGMQSRSCSGGAEVDEDEEDPLKAPDLVSDMGEPSLESVRPSPLGSYSPVRLHGALSSGSCSSCTPSPSRRPQHGWFCPGSTSQMGLEGGATAQQQQLPTPPPISVGGKIGTTPPPVLAHGMCFHRADALSSLGCLDSESEACSGPGPRMQHTHRLSPQALKWREYRRRNPLGGEVLSEGLGCNPAPQRPARPNVFDFPAAPGALRPERVHAVGQWARLQQSNSDLPPDYFSLTERPPEEFCLSPDASSPPRSSSQASVSVDLTQKKALVKSVNTAVDLIVAHFGTSRDPDVKAKLGNSWVSPNVGHLILKYLCPALRDVLQDGLKAYVLDLIIGQRRCHPWSVVEASTQLGPSTRVLHGLFSKVSQFSELTNHSMRLNAFIFGLLNLRSLEFWFSHLYSHEDIISAHYGPWGFLPLAPGACQSVFEELLLLLQPLSLLPFHLDLLFEPHLLQKGQEQLRRKEQLCSAGQSVDRSTRSTFQLMMRGWTPAAVSEALRDEAHPGPSGGRREAEGASRRAGSEVWGTTAADPPRERQAGGRADALERTGRRAGPGEAEQQQQQQLQDRQAGWWYQLMQSSQIYIDPSTEGCKFVRAEKRRKSLERRPGQAPPLREGVVEGAESNQESMEPVKSSSSSSGDYGRARGGRLSWMGSPPESDLTREREEKTLAGTRAGAGAVAQRGGTNPRWGRLFGRRPDEQKTGRLRSRPPSGWLGLDRSVRDFVALTIGSGPAQTQTPTEPSPNPPERPSEARQRPPPRQVRALCHHIATEPGQLSFNKGDVMRVLSKADPDWLLCSLGADRGLVPFLYVSLNSLEGSQDQP